MNPTTNHRCLEDLTIVYDPEFGVGRILGVKYNDMYVTANQLAGVRMFIERYCSPVVSSRYHRFVAVPESHGGPHGIQVDTRKAAQFEALLYMQHFVPFHTWEMADNRKEWDKAINSLMEEVTSGWMQSELHRMDVRRAARREALGPAIMDII